MNIISKIRQLIDKLKRREVNKDMNPQEVITALEEIESDLRGFSLVTAVLNVIDKVENLKAKITPVVENAVAKTEQVAQDARTVATDVQNADVPEAVSEVVEPVAPVEPAQPTAPVEPTTTEGTVEPGV